MADCPACPCPCCPHAAAAAGAPPGSLQGAQGSKRTNERPCCFTRRPPCPCSHLPDPQLPGVGPAEQRRGAIWHAVRAGLPVVRHLRAALLHWLLLWVQEGGAGGGRRGGGGGVGAAVGRPALHASSAVSPAAAPSYHVDCPGIVSHCVVAPALPPWPACRTQCAPTRSPGRCLSSRGTCTPRSPSSLAASSPLAPSSSSCSSSSPPCGCTDPSGRGCKALGKPA